MDKIEIIGIPSGQVIEVTTGQMEYLKKKKLVYNVPKYQNVILNRDCFMDSQFQDVKSAALDQILDDIIDDNDDDDGEYDEEYL